MEKSRIEKLAPFWITEKKENEIFTKSGEVRQSKKLAEFIRKKARTNGARTIGSNWGEAVLRVDFESGKNAGMVKFLKISSSTRSDAKIEYFAV